jgi:hypothetical protein
MKFEEISDVLKDLVYKGKKLVYKLRIVNFGEEIGFDIMVKINVKDRTNDKKTGLYTHYTYGPEERKWMTGPNLIRRVKVMLQYLETHEVEEQLLYKGMRVFDPHSKVLEGPYVEDERKIEADKIVQIKQQVVEQMNAEKLKVANE